MSGPPPGYNENASALPGGGGDAPIMRVMGGGGMPDGYNGDSLLAGGEGVTITRVMGGGGADEIKEAEQNKVIADGELTEAKAKRRAGEENPELEKDIVLKELIFSLRDQILIKEKELDTVQKKKAEAENEKHRLEGAKATYQTEITYQTTPNGKKQYENLIRITDINIHSKEVLIVAANAKEVAIMAEIVDLKGRIPRPAIPLVEPTPPGPTPPGPSPPGPSPPGPVLPGTAKTTKFQVEVNTAILPADLRDDLQTFLGNFDPKDSPKFTELITSFITRSIAKSKRYSTGSAANPQIPTKENPDVGKDYKLVHFINPETTGTLAIIPPIKGEIAKYFQYIEFLSNNNLIDENEKVVPGTVIIFMAPFFGDMSISGPSSPYHTDIHANLLYSVLHLQNSNPDSVYVLQETEPISSNNTVTIGSRLYDKVRQFDSLNPKYLLNFLNPSYLIFPGKAGKYDGIVFSSHGGMKKIKNSATFIPIQEIVKKYKTYKSGFSFNSGANDDDLFTSYLTILSNGSETVLPIHTTTDAKCNSLVTFLYNDEFSANPLIVPNNTSTDKIIFLRFVDKKTPLICSDLTGQIHGEVPEPGPFKGSEGVPGFESNAEILKVDIDGIPREFRIPTDKNNVFSNWQNALYSQKEADFLNYLKLTPEVLTILVGNDRSWKEDVAVFLKNLVESKCFSDRQILAKASCEDTRIFLNKIYEYFFDHTLERYEEEDEAFKLGDVAISRGDRIDWPIELENLDNDPPAEPYIGIDGDNNFIKLLAVHRKSGKYTYMKLTIKTADGLAEGISRGYEEADNERLLMELVKEFGEVYPEFIFITLE
jgi:hypothetical protein